MLARRISALSAPARRVVQIASVIGRDIDYALWEAVAAAEGISAAQLPLLAGELERAGIVVLGDAGYRFAHDILRSAVYNRIAGRRRRYWHQLVLTIWQRQQPAAAALLHHAARAGDRAAIAAFGLAAGAHALTAHSYRTARDAYTQALAALASDAVAARYTATLGLVQALEVLGEREAQAAAITQLVQLAQQLGDDRRTAEAAIHHATLRWSTGAFAAAAVIAQAGLQAAERIADLRLQGQLHEIAGRCARDLGDYDAAEQAFRTARSQYAALRDQRGVAWIDGMLGLVAQRRGDFQQAAEYQRRALAAYRSAGDPYHELRAATGLALAQWMLGNYLAAQAEFQHILAHARQVGDGRILESTLANLGALADILGDYQAAIELKGESLARSRAAGNQMGIAVNLCNLGITATKLGDYRQALRAFGEALSLDRATGRRQGEAYALHARGQALLAADQAAAACADLELARTIRAELGERDLLLSTEADLALALLERDRRAAQTLISHALARLQPADRADLREQVHAAAYRVLHACGDLVGAENHLDRAYEAMVSFLAPLPPQVHALPVAGRSIAPARANSPGRAGRDPDCASGAGRCAVGPPARADDFVEVRWIVATPADAALPSPAERRRHVLKRLLDEAAAQGAAPTDADLAAVLNVSRRTIIRDMAALGASGISRRTRRRMSQ
ncbi:MAG: tetratricopeptide repeat protein [Oscillochloris sp.]|nr:tetratricopeptide repeat protein [Oscillochloris sp.]